MTYAAACTERLRLGCEVVHHVTPLHGPVNLAKTLSTLDQLSQGRLDVGVGTGAEGRIFSAFGVDPKLLVSRFDEGLRLMKALWTEAEVTFEGRFWQLEAGRMGPKPFQKPPPIWFGANQPAALRRSVAHGDGFLGAGSTTTAHVPEQVGIVRRALAESGKDPAAFRIAKRIYIVVHDNAESGREQAAASLGPVYGPQLGPACCPTVRPAHHSCKGGRRSSPVLAGIAGESHKWPQNAAIVAIRLVYLCMGEVGDQHRHGRTRSYTRSGGAAVS